MLKSQVCKDPNSDISQNLKVGNEMKDMANYAIQSLGPISTNRGDVLRVLVRCVRIRIPTSHKTLKLVGYHHTNIVFAGVLEFAISDLQPGPMFRST